MGTTSAFKWTGPDGVERPLALSIALVTDDFLPALTGVGVHVQKISRELARRGHRVIVLTTRRRGQPAGEEWFGVKVYRVFSVPLYGFYQALPSDSVIRRIFLENGIDLVHFHYLGLMMLRILRLARAMRVRTLYTAHMTVDHLTQPAILKPWRKLFTRVLVGLYGRFDKVICVSRLQARRVEQFNLSSEIHYISNPVEFDGTEAPAAETVRPFTALFVGRLNPEKNIGYLLEGFQLFLKDFPEARLKIAGQGFSEGELRRRAAALGLSDHVAFLGQVAQSELPALYKECDVFVLPSLVEVLPIVALEAMRFSRPVMVTDRILCAREVVDHEVSGYIVDAGNPGDLADKLRKLRIDPDLCRRMGAAGVQKSSGYTLGSICDRLEKLYIEERAAQLSPKGPRPLFTDTAVVLDRRRQCVCCRRGTFDNRSEELVLPSNAKTFEEEYFALWRCDQCLSIHSLVKVPLAEYYDQTPFKKMRMNPYLRRTFGNLRRFLSARGLGPTSRILFCMTYGPLLQEFFKNQGYQNTTLVGGLLSAESAATLPLAPQDAIVAEDYFERLDDPQLIFVLASRLLAPCGILIINTPDAEFINLPKASHELLHQPYRLHFLSSHGLINLAVEHGMRLKGFWQRHYMDTFWPFANYRAMTDAAYFGDGSLEFGFAFRPWQIWRKWWRIPQFVVLGLFGGIFPNRSNMLAVFEKSTGRNTR